VDWTVGDTVGFTVGNLVGCGVGCPVGGAVGWPVGCPVGREDGFPVCRCVCSSTGRIVGCREGMSVDRLVG
jgi:hypothetical protein